MDGVCRCRLYVLYVNSDANDRISDEGVFDIKILKHVNLSK